MEVENKKRKVGAAVQLRKVSSVYSLFMGISMLAMWLMFYFTNSIPEIQTKPVELGLHVVAEVSTALLLIIGAIGLLLKKSWGLKTYLISMGMLLYTLIMSPGYFLQKGEIPFVIMFMVFLMLAIVLTVLIAKNSNKML